MVAAGHGPIPATLGRYRVLRRLGAGGMAEVFLARSTGAEGIEKTLVVKRILPSIAKRPRFISMFVDEAKLATRLNHPNVVQVYAFEQVRGEFLLAMEYVDGPDLSRLVARALAMGQRISPQLAAFVVAEAAKGLDYAHRRADERGQPMDIVHRDVSPQNILASHSGVVKITDFGIARARSFSEQAGVIQGKFAYMSPEQARGEQADRRTDVYSLGAVLTELLAGRPLFERGARVLEAVRKGQVPAPRDLDPDVPEELDQVARRAMAADPRDRYGSARELLRALSRYLHAQREPVDPTTLEAWIDGVMPPEERKGERQSATGLPGVPVLRAGEAPSPPPPGPQGMRERRTVFVVVGQLRRSAARGDSAQAVVVERILSDIAYKAEAVLGFSEDGHDLERRNFRLVLGMGASSVTEPLRAVRLSLDVLDALGSFRDEDADSPVCGGLGLSRGVVALARDAAGRLVRYHAEDDTFELADALARTAAPGEVLVSGEVYRLARREFAFAESRLREVALSLGDEVTPQAVRAYPLLGARGYGARLALRRAAVSGAGLVGRGTLLAQLERSVVEAVRDRRGRALRITGPLGVGKTAVVLAALERIGTTARCLHVECGFGSARDPLSTVRQLMLLACSGASGQPPADLEEACLSLLGSSSESRALAAHVARLCQGPLLRRRDEGVLDRTGRALAAVLGALSRERPLLVCIDALQWADVASLEVLGTLAQRADPVPLVYWFSGRPEPAVDRILAGVPNQALEELEPDAARELFERCLEGARAPDELVRSVLSRTGGNPLFVVEIAEAMRERGDLVLAEGDGDTPVVRHYQRTFALPAALADVVSARLSQLEVDSLDVLRWLSVVGAGVDDAELAELRGRDASAAVDDLLARGLLSRDSRERLMFASDVVRQVALEGLDLRDRAQMQGGVDTLMLRLRPYLRELLRARDLEHQGLGREAALAYAQAAHAARLAGDPADAARYLGRALLLLPELDSQRVDLYRQRLETLREAGHEPLLEAELQALLAHAQARGDARARGWAHAWLAERARAAGEGELARQRLDVARAAEAAARDDTLTAFVHSAAAALSAQQGETAAAQDILQRALSAAPEPVEAEVESRIHVLHAELLVRAQDPEHARRAALAGLSRALHGGWRSYEARALEQLARVRALEGGLEDAVWLLRAAQARTRDAGVAEGACRRLLSLGRLYADLGDPAAARQHLGRAVEVARRLGDTDSFSRASLELVQHELFDAAEPARARAALQRLEAADGASSAVVALGRGHLAAFEESWQSAAELLGTARGQLQLGAGPSPLLLAQLALAWAALGEVDQAREQALAAFDMLCSRPSPYGLERAHVLVQRALSHARLGELSERCGRRGRERVSLCKQQFRDARLREAYLRNRSARALSEVLG